MKKKEKIMLKSYPQKKLNQELNVVMKCESGNGNFYGTKDLKKYRAESRFDKVVPKLENILEIKRLESYYNEYVKKTKKFSNEYLKTLFNLLHKKNVNKYAKKRKELLKPLENIRNNNKYNTYRNFYITEKRDLEPSELKRLLQPIKHNNKSLISITNSYYSSESRVINDIKNYDEDYEDPFNDDNDLYDFEGKLKVINKRAFNDRLRKQNNFFFNKKSYDKQNKYVDYIQELTYRYNKNEIKVERPVTNPNQIHFMKILKLRKKYSYKDLLFPELLK